MYMKMAPIPARPAATSAGGKKTPAASAAPAAARSPRLTLRTARIWSSRVNSSLLFWAASSAFWMSESARSTFSGVS